MAEAPTSMTGLDKLIKKRGNIWAVTKGREVRKHIALLEKLNGN
jgi:hypothetical protein